MDQTEAYRCEQDGGVSQLQAQTGSSWHARSFRKGRHQKDPESCLLTALNADHWLTQSLSLRSQSVMYRLWLLRQKEGALMPSAWEFCRRMRRCVKRTFRSRCSYWDAIHIEVSRRTCHNLQCNDNVCVTLNLNSAY